ncbi:MAG: TetR family transcriptional regulator [Micrococcaceae bacterium]
MARHSTTPAISVESLVGTALQILQDYGLADLSMRRVAGQLGVQPSALYWHVPDKQSLLALVCDRILDDVAVPELTGDWRDDVRTRALLLHDALLVTRDAAELTASVVALGTGGHRLRELIHDAAGGSSQPGQPEEPEQPEQPADTAVLIDALVALLLGDAMIAQQRSQAQRLGLLPPEPELEHTSASVDFSSRFALLLR